jgi:acetoin utilization protein AcuC
MTGSSCAPGNAWKSSSMRRAPHLRYSSAAHGHAAESLCALADTHAQGRLLAMGGGGYNRRNLALAWTAVVNALIESKR